MTEQTQTARVGMTDEAAKWVLRFIEDQKLPGDTFAFRLGVQGGGCSGFQYLMRMDKPKPDDAVFEHNGARLIVDPKSLKLLDGSKLHFEMKYQGAGFTVINPRVDSTCGCGVSFSIAPQPKPAQASPAQ